MNTKNLMPLVIKRVNCLSIQDLPLEFVELSEEDMQHINGGGCDCACCYKNWFENRPPIPPLNLKLSFGGEYLGSSFDGEYLGSSSVESLIIP
jgi:hypothetical protein